MDERNVRVARQPLPWQAKNSTRKAFINNFSAAGGNCALLIEDAPEPVQLSGTDPRSTHVVTVSAKTPASLKRNIESLVEVLGNNTSASIDLPALSYTTTARRAHHPHRVAVCGTSLDQVKAQLQQALERGDGSVRCRAAPAITFAFTGSGSQYAGMGKQLFENYATFRDDITRYDLMAQRQGFHSAIALCSTATGPIDNFGLVTVHVASLCLEMALARLWISWGIKPAVTVGHSLGEYAALAVSGVLSEADAIYLVARRAQLLEQRCQRGSHTMLAVRAAPDVVKRCLLGLQFEIACINGPEDVVVTGTVTDLRHMQGLLQPQGIKSTMLDVPYSFHSAQVDCILDEFEQACQAVTFHKPTIPVICPLTSAVVTGAGTFSPSYLRRHCRETVNVLGALYNAHSSGIINDRSVVIEIGPQPFFCGMIKNTFNSTITALASLKKDFDTFKLVAQSLSTLYSLGCDIDWREYHSAFPASHRVLQLPAYSWELKDYWLQYVNDWSLRKGDPLPTSQAAPASPEFVAPKSMAPSVQVVPKLESTSIHRVVEDVLAGKMCSIIVETDLSRADINPLAQGHKVNGIPLTTPSVYAEIALRIGTHIADKYQKRLRGSVIAVEDMTIERALVAHGGTRSQILRSTVSFDLETSVATCNFATFDPKTQKPRQHSHCKLQFRERAAALASLQAQVEPANMRIEALRKEVDTGNAYRFSKSMIYKIVGSLAQFDPDYRQLDEIVLNSESMDASSRVSFANLTPGGAFHTNPAAIDAISQSAGFIMNGNEGANLEEEVFVNHGWASFQLFETLHPAKTYRTYAKMEEKPSKRWEGHVLVLDGNCVVASFDGVTLQGVPRRVLQYILSNENSPKPASRPDQPLPNVTASLVPAMPKPYSAPHHTVLAAPSVAMDSIVVGPRSSNVASAPVAEHVATIAPLAQISQKFPEVLQVVSEETGIPTAELTDNSEFADLGIDSLLTLQIASRLNEEMDINIEPPEFVNMRTIKDLREFIDPNTSEAEATAVAPSQSIIAAPTEDAINAVATQLNMGVMQHAPAMANAQAANHAASILRTETMEVESSTHNDGLLAKAVQIISEETGVPVDALTDDVVFADMGVDSLLSLMVVARYREELELDVPSDASMFTEFPTMFDLKHFLCGKVIVPRPSSAASTTSSKAGAADYASQRPPSTVASSTTSLRGLAVKAEPMSVLPSTPMPARPATSVILQGRPRTDAQTLMLFPDGSGSAASYAGLAPVRPGLAVVGLNSPYLRHAEEMKDVGLDQLIKSYLAEVRRRQPMGPYHFGGWSSGGILAFRAAQMLIQEGEQVDSLVLIDSPPPTRLDPLPARWYEHCAEANIFGNMPGVSAPGRGPAHDLIPHFRATVATLRHYYADPMPEGFTPRTSIVWAGACVFDGRPDRPHFETRPEDPEGIKFLTQQRTDFSAGAWATLFPLDEPEVHIMDGLDHFAIMQRANGDRLAQFISNATV